MARWQLMAPHYLNVEGVQTEDRSMGDNNKKKLTVPMHLDPNDEKQWNYKEMIAPQIMEGKIIVCHKDKGEPRDIVFFGTPTPDMQPLDDEAKEISAQHSWKPTETLNEVDSFSQRLLLNLMSETAEARKEARAQAPEGMSELMKGIADLMKMQAQLIAALTGKAVAPVEEEPEPDLGPDVKEFEVKGKGATTIRDARRLSRQVAEPAE